MPSHRRIEPTRAEERADAIDISPADAARWPEIEHARAGSSRRSRAQGGRLPGRAPARARRVPELQAPHGRGARARPRPGRRGPHPQGPRARRRLRPRDRAATRRGRRRRLVRGHRRDRPQARGSLLESEGVRPDRGGARHARSTRASTTPSSPCPGTGRPEGEIVDEVRRGYRLRDRVLRPALVAVAADRCGTHVDHRQPLSN